MRETSISLPRGASDPVNRILAGYAATQDNLLPVLHAIQDTLGFIPPDRVHDIARALNLSRAEVHGVITYYHHFRTQPEATHRLQICRAEACQSMGANQLLEHANRLSRSANHTGDDDLSVLAVYCLGLCASSPALMLNETLHGRVTLEKLDTIIAATRSSK